LPWGPVGLKHARQIKQLHRSLAALHQLQGQPLTIRGQAQANGEAIAGQRQAVQLAAGSIFDHRQPLRALLHQCGHVAAIPAEGRRTVGFMASEVAQRH